MCLASRYKGNEIGGTCRAHGSYESVCSILVNRCVQTERLGRVGVQKTLLQLLLNKKLLGKENVPRYAAVNETIRGQPAVSGIFCVSVEPIVVCIAHKLTFRIS